MFLPNIPSVSNPFAIAFLYTVGYQSKNKINLECAIHAATAFALSSKWFRQFSMIPTVLSNILISEKLAGIGINCSFIPACSMSLGITGYTLLMQLCYTHSTNIYLKALSFGIHNASLVIMTNANVYETKKISCLRSPLHFFIGNTQALRPLSPESQRKYKWMSECVAGCAFFASSVALHMRGIGGFRPIIASSLCHTTAAIMQVVSLRLILLVTSRR